MIPAAESSGQDLRAASASSDSIDSPQTIPPSDSTVGSDEDPDRSNTASVKSRWSGVASIFDQCVFTGTNFLVSVVVGRYGGANQLGQYALAFSILVITIGIQRALLMSPMVIVRGRYAEPQRREMRSAILFATVAMAMIAGLVAAVVVAVRGELATIWIGILVLAFPAALLRDYARRIAIYQFELSTATRMDVGIAVAQVLALAWLISVDLVRADWVLTISALIWLTASLVTILATRSQYRWRRTTELTAYWSQLWPIGRWVSLSAIVATTQAFVMPWIMALAASIELAGIYAACWTVVQIVSPLIEGIGNMIGPSLADQAERRSWSGLRRNVLINTGTFGLIMVGLIIAMAIAGGWILENLYGEKFANYFDVLLVLALASAANNLGIPVLKALVQLGHAKVNFYISIVGLTISLLLAWFFLRWIGPAGAAWGLVVGNGLSTAVRWMLFRSLDPVVHSSAESTYAGRAE